MSSIRCGHCDHWLGEALEPLMRVELLPKNQAPTVRPPRDMRVCKSCGRVNVFVSKKSLDGHLAFGVSSGHNLSP